MKKWRFLLVTLALLMALVNGCGKKEETKAPEKQNPGYEVLTNENEKFLLVVVYSDQDVSVSYKKIDKKQESEAVSLMCIEGENIYGAAIEEEGYYELTVKSGEASQHKTIHVEENKIYSMWFNF